MPAHSSLLITPVFAATDIGQAVFVIVALIVAFIQWLIKLMKQKSEAASRTRPMLTKEDTEARYRAWEQQTRSDAPASPQSGRATGGDTFEEIMQEMRRTVHRAVPARMPP